jgi:outer membrane receptor for ferrienterochelin and colicin
MSGAKNPLIWGNLCAGQEWQQQWSDAFKSKLSLSCSQFLDTKTDDYYRRDSVSVHFSDNAAPFDTTVKFTGGTNSRNKIVDLSGKLDNSFRLSDWNILNVGVEASWKSVIYDRDTVSVPGLPNVPEETIAHLTRPVHAHDTGVSCSFYAEDEITIGDKAGATPGLRYYYFQHSSAHAVDPRLSLWYRLLPGLTIKGACGIYTQEIHRAEEEDISGGSKFVWLLSNKNRPLEKSNQRCLRVSPGRLHISYLTRRATSKD